MTVTTANRTSCSSLLAPSQRLGEPVTRIANVRRRRPEKPPNAIHYSGAEMIGRNRRNPSDLDRAGRQFSPGHHGDEREIQGSSPVATPDYANGLGRS